jgi:hypothetical protein
MSESNDPQHQIAERLSAEVNEPSTSSKEDNSNDLHLKADKNAFQANKPQTAETADGNNESQSEGWFDTVRGAALVGKASFPDQIDYYDPEEDEIV